MYRLNQLHWKWLVQVKMLKCGRKNIFSEQETEATDNPAWPQRPFLFRKSSCYLKAIFLMINVIISFLTVLMLTFFLPICSNQSSKNV